MPNVYLSSQNLASLHKKAVLSQRSFFFSRIRLRFLHLWQPMGFPGGTSCKEPTCQWRRCKWCGFDPWLGKIPWRRPWQPTPVFLPGELPWTEEPGRLQSMGSQRVRHDWATKHNTAHACICLTDMSTNGFQNSVRKL